MRFTVLPDDNRLELRFGDVAEASPFFEQARANHGFMLHLEHRFTLFQSVTIRVEAPPKTFSFDAEVIQLFAGPATVGTAFKLRDAEAPMKALSDTDQAKDAAGPAPATPGERAATEAERSPFMRIRALNPNERFRLATKASKTERAILLRDTSPQVLLGLLNHPRIEDGEVLELVKSNYASAGIMQRVADAKKWMANREIRSAVVRSAKTPPPLAIKHLESLPTRELSVLAKGSQTREILRKAALKIYLKRTGQGGGF